MSRRVSHSLLDPYIVPVVPRLYEGLSIPRRLPPEAIVGLGHLIAIAGAVGFAFATESPWAALLAAVGVVGNHLCDMVDGTHARRTGQCRNGGELLDHFVDPLSFSYWMIGIGIACGSIELAVVAVLVIYATAVLTNIRAKMVGEFTLSRWGPTEFKTLLVVFAVGLAVLLWSSVRPDVVAIVATGFLTTIAAVGVLSLLRQLWISVREVNEHGSAPDTSEWEITGDEAGKTCD